MKIARIIVSCLLAVLSTAIMSYISMATPIGPWIAPTLVLAATIIFRFIPTTTYSTDIALVTFAGSIGGIAATGIGFSFPTVYFLDPELFAWWLARPVYFCALLFGLTMSAGGIGILIADLFEKKLVEEQKLAFPVGALVHKMIAAQQQIRKSYELLAGIVTTTLFCIVQDRWMQIPKAFVLCSPRTCAWLAVPALSLDLSPMLWAIGFVTGHVIAIPLAIGVLSKICLLDPINHTWFTTVSTFDFILAFASGMVLIGAVTGMISTPKRFFMQQKICSVHGQPTRRIGKLSVRTVHCGPCSCS